MEVKNVDITMEGVAPNERLANTDSDRTNYFFKNNSNY
jgi:hypothetical protein